MKRVGLLLVLVVAGCTKDPAPESPPPEPKPDLVVPITKPDPEVKKESEPKKTLTPQEFTFTAEQFAADSDKTWQVMIKKFGRKPIEISGEIRTIGTNTAHKAFIEFKVEGSPSVVRCYTEDQKPWNLVRPGQKVSVRGYYPPEFGFGHTLQRAKFTNVGPQPDNIVSAAKFAKDCAADTDGTRRRHKGKHVILRGLVASFNVDDYDTAELVLSGPAEPLLKISCPQFKLFSGDHPKVGDEVTVLVECGSIQRDLATFTGGKLVK